MEKYDDLLQRIKELEDTVESLNFKLQLLFENTSVDRILFEYGITKKQYNQIMDLMDYYRNKIDKNEKISHGAFEEKMYSIVPLHKGNYHFVELLTRAFWENDRWEEVFDNLYKELPKYKNIKKEY